MTDEQPGDNRDDKDSGPKYSPPQYPPPTFPPPQQAPQEPQYPPQYPPQQQPQYPPQQQPQYPPQQQPQYPSPPPPYTAPSAYWPLSIIAFLFSCLIGAIAMYFSYQVGQRVKMGNLQGAASASKAAMIWSIVGIALGVIGLLAIAGSGGSGTA